MVSELQAQRFLRDGKKRARKLVEMEKSSETTERSTRGRSKSRDVMAEIDHRLTRVEEAYINKRPALGSKTLTSTSMLFMRRGANFGVRCLAT